MTIRRCFCFALMFLSTYPVSPEILTPGIYTAVYIGAVSTYENELLKEELLSISGTPIDHYDYDSVDNAIIIPDGSVFSQKKRLLILGDSRASIFTFNDEMVQWLDYWVKYTDQAIEMRSTANDRMKIVRILSDPVIVCLFYGVGQKTVHIVTLAPFDPDILTGAWEFTSSYLERRIKAILP